MTLRPFMLRLAAFALAASAALACAETLPLPATLIGLDTESGSRMLFDSSARQAYLPLTLQFVTQKNQAYCGVATMVMLLNALDVAAPATPAFEPHRFFTQDNVLNAETERILPDAELMKKGMTLDQFGRLLGSFGVQTEVIHADAIGVDEFRKTASAALALRGRYVAVNYLRRALGQERGGHISPLAAYDARSDRFLLLDVSRYKYPPVWVSTAELHAAMNTVDADNDGKKRGFVLVRLDR